MADDLAPTFRIIVEGTTLREDITKSVLSLDFEEKLGSADQLSLTLDNSSTDTTRERMSDSKILAEGNQVEVWLGYGKKLTPVGRVKIKRHLPIFPDGGMPTITIKGYGAMSKLMVKRSNVLTFSQRKDSDIVRKIGKEHGLKLEITETSVVRNRILRPGATDFEFLKKLAKANSFEFEVRFDTDKMEDVLFFGPLSELERARSSGDKFKFVYSDGNDSTLLSFEPEFSTQGQPTEIEVLAFDRKTKEAIKVKVAPGDKAEDSKLRTGENELTEPIESGSAVTLSAEGTVIEVVANKPFSNKREAKEFAQRWFAEHEREFLTARFKTIGAASMHAYQTHQFAGLGNRISGDWQLTRVRHSMQPGTAYVVEGSARKIIAEGRFR